LGALLGITQRTIRVIHGFSHGRFSPRKLIPVNPKTTGDHLLLKRIAANLSQPEVALKAGVSERTVRAWEHDRLLPTEAQWQVLADILRLDSSFQKG
jgi:DNA-binding transcriptional regulator YiaG